MSTPFECYLEAIAENYSNTSEYWSDFKKIKDHVVQRLNWNNQFSSYFKESIPFGASAHDTQLYGDRGKFSVMLVLEIPHYTNIELYDNNDEYLMLDTTNVPTNLPIEDDSHYINRWFLQQWLKNIFWTLFEQYSMTVYGSRYQTFNLSYQLREMRHTIFAKSDSEDFIIDFVPAIKIVNENYPSSHNWHAIPKLMPGSQAKYSFMMSNTEYENRLLQDKDLKKALILMQLLCRSKGLYEIRYYHLMNLVIAKNIEEYASNHSLQDIFLEILCELYNAINNEYLPYMWDNYINLLSNLSPKILSDYEIILDKAYDTLNTYDIHDKLSYERCKSHFC
ncbi:uncharacterized protein LOC117785861 [Drosophila innubila]|uniref:uncharacterized protein LOC117785861 n=1 Tax=Drosophila innubila TaxID=198719 RepID=UPI00148BA6E2|nr:uncharacterized protein LOC117785861 [Drosophila innubila]